MIDRDTVNDIVSGIADEDEAFTLIHALRAKFGMVGAEFCRGDIETIWNGLFDDGDVEELFSDEHWDACLAVRSWNRTVQDRMIEVGHEVITDVVIEDIDTYYYKENHQ